MYNHRKLFNSLFAALLVVAASISSVLAQNYQLPAKAKGAEKTFSTGFEVTIRNRSDLKAPYMILGNLTIIVAASGVFTGHINPAKDENGHLVSTVLFHFDESGIVPEPNGPQSLEVAGQINGHAFNLAIKLPDGNYIFGAGTSVADLSALPSGQLDTFIGGSATTSIAGDSGDWAGRCIPTCFVYNGQRYCLTICY